MQNVVIFRVVLSAAVIALSGPWINFIERAASALVTLYIYRIALSTLKQYHILLSISDR